MPSAPRLLLPPQSSNADGQPNTTRPRTCLASLLVCLLALWLATPAPAQDTLTNGVMHTGNIAAVGQTNVWTFTASAGDNMILRAGKLTGSSTLVPWVRLFNPNGVLLSSSFGAAAAEASARATNSGLFRVEVSDGSASRNGTGDYRLTLARTGDLIVVSPGDEGGPQTNGLMHTGVIDNGDMDLWSFSASSGDNIVVRMGEVTVGSTLTPWVRLFGPTGVLLDSGFGAAAGEVTARATNSGVFLVVVTDGNVNLNGTGDYRLTLARTGDLIVISPGDEGGPQTNGLMHTGVIDNGDMDLWSFSASSGDNIVVRMGEVTVGSTLTPWVRLFGPSGVLLDSGFGAAAGEVTTRATNSGVFLVVVTDGNVNLNGTGDYRLTLARTGGSIVTFANDEGGLMNGAASYDGALPAGDLEVWVFTACAGDAIHLQLDELPGNAGLTPWLRLYGRDGALLNSTFNASSAVITRQAPAYGSYVVVAGDGSVGLDGSGPYRFTTAGLYAGIRICPMRTGTNMVFLGAGGEPGQSYALISSTNVAIPLALWTPILTNQFLSFGEFSLTNAIDLNQREEYFGLRLQ